jgi:hypothetical protein
MITYSCVEDYLEYLGGYEFSPTASIFPTKSNRISLARYDIQIVDSMSSTTVFGTALTDKQAELAVKLILKYRKQFAKLGVDVTPIENPVFRITPRKIDRTKAIWIESGKIVVKFPYNNELIKDVLNYRSERKGAMHFDRENKVWNLGITEFNVNWVVTWGELKEFDISPEVHLLFNKVIECEQQLYEIKLVKDDTGLKITNAAESLINYINENLGGFDIANAVKLVDYAGILGYTVDDMIIRPALLDCFINHTTYIQAGEETLDMLFDYAEITNRYPICIYNPTLFELDLTRFDDRDIVRFDRNGKTKTSNYDPYHVKIVYAQKIPTIWEFPVPLMVTTFEMMFGGKKMDWTRRAEKIVYYGTTQLRENN